jgi:SAM-dependent methyltransferase
MIMFRQLQRINERPAVFSHLTTADLWTDPHTSEQMLRHHLDGSVDVSSRKTVFIDASVAWITEAFHLTDQSRVLDLGCGPGLYTNRLAQSGVDVTGIDFSSRSIAYARKAAARDGLTVTYVNEDYLAWESNTRFDLITMIFCDYCALAPRQRRPLLRKIERLLELEGSFLFDVCSLVTLDEWVESAGYTAAPDGGFWSPNPYFEFLSKFVYPEERVTLDKYEIVESGRSRTIYNWLQHFDREALAAELRRAGLEVASVLGDVAGRPFDPSSPEFAVIARRGSGYRRRRAR